MLSKLFDRLLSFSAPHRPQELKKAYAAISQAYRNHTSYKIRTPLEAYAYACARMPATASVLRDVLTPIPAEQITSLLDLGGGPGSLLWAKPWDALNTATLVDRSSALMAVGKALSPPSCEWIQSDILSFQPQQAYDLVVASYVLNELTLDQQETLLQTMWKASTQYIVVVEPGTPTGFQAIQRARETLIEQGAFSLAPCTHESLCPMSQEDWCHFSTRLTRNPLHRSIKGRLDYEDEKYSYFIATKRKLREDGSARIVKKPLKSKGLIQLDVCHQEGLKRVKIPKSQEKSYKKAKAYTWGDIYLKF